MIVQEAVLGIDLGTEGARAVIFDLAGRRLCDRSRSYETRFPCPGWAEQDPWEIWTAVVGAVSSVVRSVDDVELIGCSVVSTAATVLPIDAAGAPLRSAILWMDTRAAEEAAEISATGHNILRYTGGRVSPEWMLPKALWLHRHAPDLYERTRYMVEVHDWVMYRLTGQWTLSLSTISAEWTYAEPAGGWAPDLLAAIGISDIMQRWPQRIVEPGQLVGMMAREAGQETGLPEGLPVAQGLMDSYAAALACNVYQPGRLTFSLGSSSSYLALTDMPIVDHRLLGPVPDAFGRGTWALQGGQTSAAATVRWFHDQCASTVSYAQLDAEAARVPPGSDGVRALETMQGSRTPDRNPAMRGALWGLSLAHQRCHLYRSLLEAVAYGGRQVIETLDEAGVATNHIIACGGGSRSSLWMQIHADVFGREISVLDEPNAAALGAAICAAVSAGAYPDLASAARLMTSPGSVYSPSESSRAAYEEGYAEYQAAYASHSSAGKSSPPCPNT